MLDWLRWWQTLNSGDDHHTAGSLQLLPCCVARSGRSECKGRRDHDVVWWEVTGLDAQHLGMLECVEPTPRHGFREDDLD